ncbi:conserved membrane protein of unknown function [Candidatus Hydrogenisulfobacillus filiaventi]|uniref:Glycerophosphoryl diester phosphodiesterase membrane domain-containing protein n=1 Tax=Candidatus Hydrogenisulfobacillus filiaventi TaxID=2707344 RepID=A0A6F8ZCX3_9FIRM|nr:hypothetical protein [Bacillota bacterium]CAB1127522.1 conserved membrane protein of unknown function [Candidatus Hydrogenisulfobacillus filiaventi]
MFDQAFALTRAALRQGAVWSVAVWSLVFFLLFLLVMTLTMGAAAAVPLLHPFSLHPRPFFPMYPPNPLRVVSAMFLILLLAVAAGPFWMAGAYGTLADAVLGTPLDWSSFWSNARRQYGRAWGAILYSVLFTVAVLIVALVLGVVLHVVGAILTGLLVLAALALPVRMVGGLFLRGLAWGEALRETWLPAGYGALWAGLVAYGVLAFLAMLVLSGIAAFLPILGPVLVLVADAALQVIGGVWSLALYQATSRTPVS